MKRIIMHKLSNNYAPLAGLLALALLVGLLSAPAAAQDWESCYEAIYRTVRTPNPFTGAIIERDILVRHEFDSACNTVQDNRVNQDNAAAAAIYCVPEGVAIWDIDDLGRGDLAFLVTWSVLDAFPAQPAENTLLVEHGGFSLYRLTSGELQLSGPPDWEGKAYSFAWAGCERPAAMP